MVVDILEDDNNFKDLEKEIEDWKNNQKIRWEKAKKNREKMKDVERKLFTEIIEKEIKEIQEDDLDS